MPTFSIVLVGFYLIVSTSLYVRYWVDDFCSAAFLKDNGFWGAQIGWWKSWTGRYSAVFFTSLFELFGSWVVRFLPIFLFLLLVFTFYLIFKNFLTSALFVLLVFINSPNIIQSFYWQTGSLNYTAEFIFLNLFLVFLFTRKRTNIVFPFLFTFIAGGFSEAFALGSIPPLLCVGVTLYVFYRRRGNEKLKVWFAGLLGILSSLVLMSFSPGNEVRSEFVTRPESFSFVVRSTLLATKWYLLRMFSIDTFVYSLFVAFLNIFLFFRKVNFGLRYGLFSSLIFLIGGILSVMLVIFTGFYTMSILPPERTLFLAVTLFLYSFFASSFFIVGVVNKFFNSKIKIILNLALFLNLFFSLILFFDFYPHWVKIRKEIRDYAIVWDVEVKNLPEIGNIKPVGGLDSFTDNKGWVSSCIAKYYGFNKVIVK